MASNTFTNFFQTVFSDTAYLEFANSAIAPQVTNLTWVDPGAPALAIRIPKFAFSTAQIDDVANLIDTPDAVSESTLILNLDQNKGFHFEIEYTEQDRANVQLGENVLRQRSAALAAVVDQRVFACASGQGTLLSGASLNKATLVSAIEILNSGNAPQTDRVLVTDPVGYSDLLNANDFVQADSIAGATANMTGYVGTVLGVEVFLSNNLADVGDSVNALIMHRAALAMAMLKTIEVKVFDQPRHFSTGYTGRAIWGCVVVDSSLIVRFNRL